MNNCSDLSNSPCLMLDFGIDGKQLSDGYGVATLWHRQMAGVATGQ